MFERLHALVTEGEQLIAELKNELAKLEHQATQDTTVAKEVVADAAKQADAVASTTTQDTETTEPAGNVGRVDSGEPIEDTTSTTPSATAVDSNTAAGATTGTVPVTDTPTETTDVPVTTPSTPETGTQAS